MAFFKNTVASIVNNGYMKVVILLIFAVYLFGAGYGITQIKEGLERRKLSKEDSYSVKFFDLEDEYYREFPYRMQVIVAGELNYADTVSYRDQRNVNLHELQYSTYNNISFCSKEIRTPGIVVVTESDIKAND